MITRFLPALLILSAAAAPAAEQVSAMTACKALPKALHRSIARLGAKGGKPSPEIWTIVTRDGKAANGLREYTVTAGTVVATRGSSDLAEKITSSDVIGLNGFKVDSDQLAELAAGYAAANNVAPASFDYDLRKEGEDAAPLWTITAYNDAGTKLGSVVLAAHTGSVISHEGFALTPDHPNLTSDVEEAQTANAGKASADKEEASAGDGEEKPAPKKKRMADSDSEPEKKRPGTFRRVGGHLQKFFTGKNTIGR